MAAYTGRDCARIYQLAWWIEYCAGRPHLGITEEELCAALERLRAEPARVYVGLDADGRKVHRGKPKARSAATVNRYQWRSWQCSPGR